MGKKNNYFSIGSKLFWGLILLVTVFALLKLNPGIFNGENTARDIIVEDSLSKVNWEDQIVKEDSIKTDNDTSLVKKDDFINRTWKWKSFDQKSYTLIFKIKSKDYSTSQKNREASKNYESKLYTEMFYTDNVALGNMIEGYKKIIKENSLDYYESLNMIITSIQNIPYVLVMPNECPDKSGDFLFANDCQPRKTERKGCCGYILPYGVYSPTEFAVNSTGDCDTRSLFAYTILKKIGYDVAVMNSDSEGHSVLGVLVPNIPSDGKTGSIGLASNYFLWELTAYGWQLGQRIDGNDWRIALN